MRASKKILVDTTIALRETSNVRRFDISLRAR